MKYYIIVAVLLALLVGVVASAKGELDAFYLTKAGQTSIYKFVDGKTTCYVADKSISCLK